MTISRLAATVAASAALLLAPVATTAALADEVISLPSVTGSAPEAGATATAPDAHLRAGCRDYPVRYAVRDAGEDWMLDLIVRDRSGEQVSRMTLHGVEHGAKGWTSFSVCREAVEAGRFTVSGLLTEREGYEQTEHTVEPTAFRLTRR